MSDDLNAENQRLREQLAVVRKQADDALALHAEVELQLIAITAARDEACELGEEFIPEDYEPAYSRIAELRKVGPSDPRRLPSLASLRRAHLPPFADRNREEQSRFAEEIPMNTLGDELPKQIARVRDVLIPAYLECGPAGMFAVAGMRADLDAASKAMIEGDIVAMVRISKKLKEWQL